MQLMSQRGYYGNRRGRVLVCWPKEGCAEYNQKLPSNCRFSATSCDPEKAEPDAHRREGEDPHPTHTTGVSPGRPAADGQLTPGRGKELAREKGSLFIF